MKRWLLMTMALTVAACGTTALDAGARAVPTQHIADDASSDEGIETTDSRPDQPAIVVTATSPEHVQFSTEVKQVVLLAKPHGPARSHRKTRVREGMMIGAAVGVLASVLAAADADSGPDVVCGGGCQAILGSAVYGAIGLGLGAAAGGIIGLFEDP